MKSKVRNKSIQEYFIILGCVITFFLLLVIIFKYAQKSYELVPVKMLLVRDYQYNQQSFPQYLNVSDLKVGDAEISNAGIKEFEITKITRTQEGPNQIVIIEGSILAKKNPNLSGYRYKNQDVYIGSTVQFFPSDTMIYGQVIDINNVRLFVSKTLHLKGKMLNQYRWFAQYLSATYQSDNLQISDQVVIKSISYSPTSIDTIYSKNSILFGRDNLAPVDIELEFDLPVTESGGDYYFSYIQSVKVGNQLYIPTKLHNLYGVYITQIQD